MPGLVLKILHFFLLRISRSYPIKRCFKNSNFPSLVMKISIYILFFSGSPFHDDKLSNVYCEKRKKMQRTGRRKIKTAHKESKEESWRMIVDFHKICRETYQFKYANTCCYED